MVKNLPTVERSTKIRFGKYALDDQAENTIVYNASNVAINANTPGSIYMTPLRSEDIRIPDVKILTYNRITKEILDSNVTSDDLFSLNLEDITIQGNVTSNTIQFVNEATAFVTLANVGISNTNPVDTLSIGDRVFFSNTSSDYSVKIAEGAFRHGTAVLINSAAPNHIQVTGNIDTTTMNAGTITVGTTTFLKPASASGYALDTTGNVNAQNYRGDSYFLSNLTLNNIINQLDGNVTASKTVQFNKSGTSLITRVMLV